MYYSMPTPIDQGAYRYSLDVEDRGYNVTEEADYGLGERRNSLSETLERRNVDFDIARNQIRPSQTPTKSKSPTNRPVSLRGSLKRRHKTIPPAVNTKSSYEAYEERMLPALRK